MNFTGAFQILRGKDIITLMEQKTIDYDKEHYCPVYDKVIDSDLCYDSLMCLGGLFKVSSLKELTMIEDINHARKLCKQCEYSKL